MLNIKLFEFNPFNENTYLIWDESTKDAAVIDPGCYDDFEQEELKSFIEKEKLNVILLLNTHCHIDHILGVPFVRKNFRTKYLIPEKDLPLLNNSHSQAQLFGFDFEPISDYDEFISEDKTIKIGNEELIPLFTPGHTPGEFCFYSSKNNLCFTGDVLFHQSIGRTDLWGGNYDILIGSIKDKLLVLPEETKIFPGHGIDSTIGKELKQNPFLMNL